MYRMRDRRETTAFFGHRSSDPAHQHRLGEREVPFKSRLFFQGFPSSSGEVLEREYLT